MEKTILETFSRPGKSNEQAAFYFEGCFWQGFPGNTSSNLSTTCDPKNFYGEIAAKIPQTRP